MSLSSVNSIGQTACFELESGNENVDRQMDRQTTRNGQADSQTNRWNYQFRKEPSYDGDLCPHHV